MTDNGDYSESSLEEFWTGLHAELLPRIANYRSKLPRLAVSLKDDKTFLTNADTEIEDLIAARISQYDPSAQIVGDERHHEIGQESEGQWTYTWVVDPIDGTSQFIDADAHDFCTAIAILRDGQPYASYICLYEVANHALQTTSFVPTHMVRLEGKPVIPPVRNATMRASVTGKRTESWPDLDRYLEQHNYLVKKKATSQTIDLLRTCQVVPALMPSFDLFYRQDQRLWDGLPGIAVAQSLGMTVTTLHPNEPHLPLSTAKLHMRNPEFKSTLVANKDLVDDIIRDLLSGVRS